MKKALEELKGHAKALKNVLKDKEGEISLLRKPILQAKEDEKMEFRNSDAFLYELSVATMLTILMSASFRSRLSSLTWTCLRSLLMSWPKPQPDSSILKVPTSCLRLTPLSTLEVTERPLYKKNRLNLLRARTVLLRRPRWLSMRRLWTRRPSLTNLRFCKFNLYFFFIKIM